MIPASTTYYAVMAAALNDYLNRMSRELVESLKQIIEVLKQME